METTTPLDENKENKENKNEFEKENEVLRLIKDKFPETDIENARVSRRRIFVLIDSAVFLQTLEFAAHELGFSHLSTITGIDSLDSFEFLYHISNDNGILMTLKLKVPRSDDAVISSVLPIYNGATFYEKELESLLGVKVEGLPEGRQYPLPDNWPKGQYPLRKDWTPAQKDTAQSGATQKDDTTA